MNYSLKYRLSAVAALFIGLLALLPGCVADNAEFDAPSKPGYHMTLTVVTTAALPTRAHEDDEQQNGTVAENAVDFTGNDFRLVFFDKAGNYLHAIDGTAPWTIFPYTTNGDYSVYRMECEIEFPESVTKEQIAALKTDDFQVMLLANWQSIRSEGYNGLFGNGSGGYQSLAQIWKDNTNYNFPYTPAAGNLTWCPDHTAPKKQLIPMFGYAKSPKFTPGTGGQYSNTTILMQRAVAKIEVIDNLTEQPDLSVNDVVMSGYNTSGRLIPDVAANPNWDKVGQQVDRSSLPADVRQAAGLNFVRDPQQAKKWIAYVPEMALPAARFDEKGEITNPDERPHLKVSIVNDPSSSFYDQYKGDTYVAHFAKYNSDSQPTIPDDSWNHILRNHIYRFSINKVGLTVKLHLHVMPWEADDDEAWDFTDHVTVSSALEWLPESYEHVEDADYQDRNIVLWLDGTILKGSFTIATPRNGRWYARLVPIGAARPNAVSFVNQKGDILDPSAGDPRACMEVSGLIDGTEQYLYIRPTDFGNDYESRFKLEFWVENLGVWMNVPMPEGPYTIIRKANIIE